MSFLYDSIYGYIYNYTIRNRQFFLYSIQLQRQRQANQNNKHEKTPIISTTKNNINELEQINKVVDMLFRLPFE